MHVPLTPVRALYRAVDLYGKKTGVVCGDRRFTYAEFGERVERLAFGLLSEGVLPGDRVAYLSFNTHQLLEGYFAAPAHPRHRHAAQCAPHRRRIDRHPEPRRTARPGLRGRFRAPRGTVAPGLPRRADAGSNPASPTRNCSSRGRIQRPDFFTFDEREIAELFYTSGSTGTPKGVTLSHRTLYLHMLGVSATFYNDETMVELHTIPLFHANGWGRPQCATFHGLKQVMVRRFDPAHVLRLIQEEKATSMSLVPTMANALLNCPELGKWDVSSLRQIHLGGAASSPELIARLEAAFPCPAHGRLRPHRNRARRHQRARQIHRAVRR